MSITLGAQGLINTAASVHLRDAIVDMKKEAPVNKEKSFRQINTRQVNPIVQKTDSSIIFEGEKRPEAINTAASSVEAVSKLAV